jgi:hypothetical protein
MASTTPAPSEAPSDAAAQNTAAPTRAGAATTPTVTARKVTVNFAPETYETLSGIAKQRNVSMSEALRQAIGLMAFIVEETMGANPKGKLMINRSGEISELRLL